MAWCSQSKEPESELAEKTADRPRSASDPAVQRRAVHSAVQGGGGKDLRGSGTRSDPRRAADRPFPDIRFHDELASWPIPWREVWGWVTNAIEDACKADGMPTGGAELGAFAEVARLRGNGMTPEEALTAIWDA